MKIGDVVGGSLLAAFGLLFVLVAPIIMRAQRDPSYPIATVHRLTAVGSDRAFQRSLWVLRAVGIALGVAGAAFAISAL